MVTVKEIRSRWRSQICQCWHCKKDRFVKPEDFCDYEKQCDEIRIQQDSRGAFPWLVPVCSQYDNGGEKYLLEVKVPLTLEIIMVLDHLYDRRFKVEIASELLKHVKRSGEKKT